MLMTDLIAAKRDGGKLSAEERPVMGQIANSVRAALEDLEIGQFHVHTVLYSRMFVVM